MKTPSVLASLLLVACAAPPVVPNDQIALARTALEEARRAGAGEHAASELAQAQDKFAQAEAAVERKEMGSARRLAEASEVDARLAQARAEARRVERELATLNSDIKALRKK
jgi:hypothetical protein